MVFDDLSNYFVRVNVNVSMRVLQSWSCQPFFAHGRLQVMHGMSENSVTSLSLAVGNGLSEAD